MPLPFIPRYGVNRAVGHTSLFGEIGSSGATSREETRSSTSPSSARSRRHYQLQRRAFVTLKTSHPHSERYHGKYYGRVGPWSVQRVQHPRKAVLSFAQALRAS